MILFKILIINILLLYTTYRIGMLFSFRSGSKSLGGIMSKGFIIHFAIFEIVAIPFLFFHLSFNIIFYLYIVYTLILIVLSYVKTSSVNFQRYRNLLRVEPGEKIIFYLTTTLISLQVFLSSYLFHSDADDSFYVSLINSCINNKHLYSNDPSTGIKEFPLMSQYIFESWELFQAILSKLFNVSPAIISHTIIPCFLIICTYFVYYYFAENLEFQTNPHIFVFFMCVLNIMGAYTDYSSSFFLLGRVWQGKSIIVNIIIPLIYIYFKNIMDNEEAKEPIIMLTLVSIVGMAFNPIIIYLMPLLLASLAVWTVFSHKDIKNIFKAMLKYLIVFVPLILFATLIKINISKSYIFDNPSNSLSNFNSIAIFNAFFMSKGYLFLFIISAIYLLRYGSKYIKIVAIGSPLVLSIFIYNPKLAPIIAQHLTSFPTYWRVFWLLPITYVIAYTFTHICQRRNILKFKKVHALVFSALTLVAILLGSRVYCAQYGFSIPENAYKIPQEIVSITSYVTNKSKSDILVLAPEELNTTMRQLSNSIVLFRSRDFYLQDFLITRGQNDIYKEREELYNYALYGNINNSRFNGLIKKYGIDVIIINKSYIKNIQLLKNSNLEIDKETSNYLIYFVKK